jgi:lactoylglutathione lyase
MRIEHLAIWSKDIEHLKRFYVRYFDCTAGELYFNPKKNFQSYFLSFESGCRLEIMQMPGIAEKQADASHEQMGLIHFAISVGGKEQVDTLTEMLRADGYQIIGEPRTTGDGYYESVVLDPEQNRIEITI